MRKFLLVAVALGGLTAITTSGAVAATPAFTVHGTQVRHGTDVRPSVIQADYYWNRRHWHHRRWEHHRWRYYD